MRRRDLLAALSLPVAGATAGCLKHVPEVVRADARDAVSVDVEPSTVSPERPAATATIRNNALVPVETNLAAWTVRRDGEVVVPEGWAQPLHRLAPGESHTDDVRLGGDPTEFAYSDATVRLGDLDAGRYTFGIAVGVGDRSQPARTGFRVERDST